MKWMAEANLALEWTRLEKGWRETGSVGLRSRYRSGVVGVVGGCYNDSFCRVSSCLKFYHVTCENHHAYQSTTTIYEFSLSLNNPHFLGLL